MFLTVLIFFVVSLFAIAVCVVIRKRLLSLILTAIAVLTFLWLFTSVPIRVGLIKLPVIELVKVRATIDDDHPNGIFYENGGVIEFISDKNFEEFDIRKSYILRLVGANRGNFTYQDMYEDKGFITVIESNNVYLEKQINDRYLYKATFDIEIPTSEIKETIYCKVFLVQMFTTIFGTNEICIPRDSLLLITGEAGHGERIKSIINE